MKTLTRSEFNAMLPMWYEAWNRHDLDAVMDLFHDDVVFVHWNGVTVSGKKALREQWKSWFKSGQFQFLEQETFIDELNQKVLFRWALDWPSPMGVYKLKREVRSGLDVLHFQDGKIIKKLTYTRTDVEIDGKRLSV